jgi:hypothetical protein
VDLVLDQQHQFRLQLKQNKELDLVLDLLLLLVYELLEEQLLDPQ